MQPPMLGPGFLSAAGDFENETKDLPSNLFDGRGAGGDAPGVNINQVGPALGQCRAR